MNIKHASIIPLIGGETIGQSTAFQTPPEFLLSYTPFRANDAHCVNHFGVPYHLLDGSIQPRKLSKVDVVNAVCPCAGLSTLSVKPDSNAPANDWLIESTRHVLGVMKPRVLWGENAPCLASKVGEPVIAKMRALGKEHGYTMSMYRTQSWLHNLPQVRERTFYFFWREKGRVPVMPYFKNHRTIEQFFKQHDHIAKRATQHDCVDDCVKSTRPSADPIYRYILEDLEGGITHAQFNARIEKTANLYRHIESKDDSFERAAKWLTKNHYAKAAARCRAMDAKLASGKNVMRNHIEVPKFRTSAFVGHFPTFMTHPTKDRFLTYRECMSLMGLPLDFQLLEPRKSLNHVCQNVPVTTAFDMATGVLAYLNGQLPFEKCEFAFQRNHTQTFVACNSYAQ